MMQGHIYTDTMTAEDNVSKNRGTQKFKSLMTQFH